MNLSAAHPTNELSRFLDWPGGKGDLAPLTGPAQEGEVNFSTDLEGVVARLALSSEIANQAFRAAKATSSVLIIGEQGTGKQVLAEAVHRVSVRRNAPFIVFDASAEVDRADVELFGGQVEGGAEGSGRLEAADGGTVCIKHLCDLPRTAQARLSQFLEKGTVAGWSDGTARPLNVRVTATSRCELEPLVEAKSFREDLYYLLSVVVIHVPPLRERLGRIPAMVERLLEELCRIHHLPLVVPDQELLHWLKLYNWPGNFRQLRTCLETMVIMARGRELTLADLPSGMMAPAAAGVR